MNNNVMNKKKYSVDIILFFIVIIQLSIVYYTLSHSVMMGDEIFTYTLANSPYEYNYIDHMWKYFDNTNGWIDGDRLKNDYIVNSNTAFDYSKVYWHQRIDNHPLLYYSLVHTLSSLNLNRYSNMTVGIINIMALLLIDLLIILICKEICNDRKYSIAIIISTILVSDFFIHVLSNGRMYACLAVCCLWYLYIHIKITINNFNKKLLMQMLLCIVLASQIHYYFYVYAACVTLVELIILVKDKKFYELVNYCMIGIFGLIIAFIIFPWTFWHIFYDQMQKHTVINLWSIDKLKKLLFFSNRIFFNGRFGALLIVTISLLLLNLVYKNKGRIDSLGKKSFKEVRISCIILFSTILYILIIYTIDEDVIAYQTPAFVSIMILIILVFYYLMNNILKSENLKCSIQLLSILLIYGISTFTFISKSNLEYDRYVLWHSMAEKNHLDDCIYVESIQDNLLNNLWFEIAQYDEVKKINIEDFINHGIDEFVLEGRKSCDGDVYIYIESDYHLDDEYIYIDECYGHKLYKMVK